MRDNPIKRLVRRHLFPDGAVRRIISGPLRGFRYRVSPITGMETWYSGHERDMQRAMAAYVRTGDTVLDVGANWGGHSLLLSRLVGPGGRVIACEPSPCVAAETRWHLSANEVQNVTLLELALADQPGTATFDTQTLSTTGKLVDQPGQAAASSVTVQVQTLDQLVADLPLPALNFVKVDVEGAESKVLLGARHTLEKLRPRLIVELHNPEQDVAVARILLNHHYRLTRLDGSEIRKLDCGWPDRDGVWGTIIAHP